jgi:dolichol-phosphate mannosyltransferase
LSFVLPAYNEGAYIEATLDTLDRTVKETRLRYEVVLVDDGSIDRTREKAVDYANRNGHVKVIGYDKNVGKGYAVKKGFMEAVGDAVVFVDSDMEIDLETISCYVEALRYADIVIASKWHPDSVVEMSLIRKILSHGFNVLVRILTGADLKDTQVGLKAMKKKAFTRIFRKLIVRRYAFDVELLVVASLFDLKIVEMPTHLKLNESFKVKEIVKMFVDLLGIAYRLKVLHWYQRFT